MPHCSKMQVAAISCSYFAKLCFSYFANWPLWLSDSDTAMSNAKAIWRELSSVLEILACGYIYSVFHKTFLAFPTLTKCCSSRGGWMLQSCEIILKITLLPLWAQDWLGKKKEVALAQNSVWMTHTWFITFVLLYVWRLSTWTPFPEKSIVKTWQLKSWTGKILPKLFLGQHYVAACFQKPGFVQQP